MSFRGGIVRQIDPLEVPRIDAAVSGELRRSADQVATIRAGKRVSVWLCSDPANTKNAGRLSGECLGHELSPFFAARRRERVVCYPPRSLTEIQAFRKLRAGPANRVIERSNISLQSIFAEIRALHGLPSAFRGFDVGTVPDLAGNSVRYPSYEEIDRQVDRISEFISTNIVNHPYFCALFSYVAILNIHPFSDGNGRLARTVYNWILDTEGERSYYCPIYEIDVIGGWGVLLFVREAMYYNRWVPLAKLFGLVDQTFYAEST